MKAETRMPAPGVAFQYADLVCLSDAMERIIADDAVHGPVVEAIATLMPVPTLVADYEKRASESRKEGRSPREIRHYLTLPQTDLVRFVLRTYCDATFMHPPPDALSIDNAHNLVVDMDSCIGESVAAAQLEN